MPLFCRTCTTALRYRHVNLNHALPLTHASLYNRSNVCCNLKLFRSDALHNNYMLSAMFLLSRKLKLKDNCICVKHRAYCNCVFTCSQRHVHYTSSVTV
ncbi:unnamed protein product, partial [Arabidopsis halleri]